MKDTILIWGAGAIGGTIGANLVRAGINVQMVDIEPDHARICSDVGLSLEGPVQNFTLRVPCVTPGELDGVYKRIVLAVKSPATAESVSAIISHLDSDGFILSAQNGLNEHYIAEKVGEDRVMGCFVNFGADWLEPGKILYGNRGAFVIGEIDGSIKSRTREMHKLMSILEPKVVLTNNIMGYLWGKMCYGAMLFATALTGESMAANFADPTRTPILTKIGKEVLTVASAEGIRPEGFDGFDPSAFMSSASPDAASECMAKMALFNLNTAKTHSGIHRDIVVRRRPTEVDYQPGVIVKIAASHSIETPFLKRLIELVHDLEKGRREVSPEVFHQLNLTGVL